MTEKQFKLFVGKNYGVQKADGEVIFDSIVSIGDADVLVDLLNDLAEENEQLKQRNENQYKQLNKLWELIQAKDWETLTAMDNQMKEDEERLQQEWKCYE